MKTVYQTNAYKTWATTIDTSAFKIVVKAVDKVRKGIMTHTRSLSGGLFEIKINFAKGIRIYFINKNEQIIILLAGGDKTTQQKDIIKARILQKIITGDKK